jgi:indolepyruvate decarboxylase
LLHHKIRSFESQLVIFREVTCAAAVVTDAESAQRTIDGTLAASLRHSRPVYLELPRDQVDRQIDPIEEADEPEASDDAALAEALAETASLVAGARQPVILAGEELARFGIYHDLPGLIERTGIPAAVTTLSKAVIDEMHPLFLGVYEGALGNESTRRYVEESDCLLILGANLSDATLGINTARLDPARTISVSSERLAVRRHDYHDVRFVDFVAALPDAIGPRTPPAIVNPDRPAAWVAEPDAPITIARLFQCLNGVLARDTAVVADVGDALFAGIDLVVEKADFVAPAYYLSLGFAIPGAIGVQLARPDVRPLVLVGDGAFQMTGMELSTVVRYGLDPIVILLDNGGYGTERPMLDGPFNDILPWRYAEIPAVLGAGRGYEIRTEGDLETALSAASADRSGFSLLHVRLQRGDLSPALQRMTSLMSERIR